MHRFVLFLLMLSAVISGCSGDDAKHDNVAVSGLAQAGDTDKTSPGSAAPPVTAVVSETIAYADVDGELVRGHFVFPADMVDPLPALLVIHEWWGLNDNVKSMADQLAAQGYIVLAVDLFGGETANTPAAARKLMLGLVEDQENGNDNLRQAYGFLETVAGAPRIGSIGWGMGGSWALNAALLFPTDLDASVVYYGQVTADAEALQPLEVPVLGIFGSIDRSIPVAAVREFETTLQTLRKTHEIEVYDGAAHAFVNPTGRNYYPRAAERAWERTLGFLEKHLKQE